MQRGPMAIIGALIVGLVQVVVLAEGAGSAPAVAQASIAETIEAAGNTDSEESRYELLTGLRDQLEPEHPLAADLDVLLPTIDRWANGLAHWEPGDQAANELGYLAGFFNIEILRGGPGAAQPYPPEVAEASPLRPIWAMYRGRILIQAAIQFGFIARNPDVRAAYMDEGRAHLEVAADAFPQNEVVRMWLGEPIPWPSDDPPAPDAPAWARAQRESIEKLYATIEFWIEERQAPDGQFGGGWEDDVEMWRQWTPILVGFDDAFTARGWGRLAEGIYDLPRLSDGYSSVLTDVQHSSEDSGDTGTSMLLIDSDPVWRERAMRLAELMGEFWTGINDRGRLQFKSNYFTATEIAEDAAFACDTPTHLRAVGPALLLWQQSEDPTLTELFTSWLDTWVEAAATAERGKPAGVPAAAISWPSGEPAGPQPEWWDPGCALAQDQGLYDWPTFVDEQLRAMVLAHQITGEERYLAPLRSLAEIRRQYLSAPTPDPEPGSLAWVGRNAGSVLDEPLAKYRLLTGDPNFDDLLADDAYVEFLLSGDETELVEALETNASALQVNEAAYTTEVRWTDRLFSFPREYANYYVDPPLPRFSPELLYRTLTGDPGDPAVLPLNGVRWRTEPDDFAALVDSNEPDRFSALLHHFGTSSRPMGAELLQLEPGPYRWSLSCEGSDVESGAFTVASGSVAIEFTLPPARECDLDVAPPAADLTIRTYPRSRQVVAGEPLTYTAVVTNEGPADASYVAVTEELPPGAEVVSATSGWLERPCAIDGASYSCPGFGNLPPGAATFVTVTVRTTDVGPLTLSPTLTAFPQDPHQSAIADPEEVEVVEPGTESPVDLQLRWSGTEPFVSGQTVTGVAWIDVPGPRAAAGAQLEITQGENIEVVSAARGWFGVRCPKPTSCALPSISSERSTFVLFRFRPLAPGPLSAEVSVSAAEPDPDPSTNSVTIVGDAT